MRKYSCMAPYPNRASDPFHLNDQNSQICPCHCVPCELLRLRPMFHCARRETKPNFKDFAEGKKLRTKVAQKNLK